MEDLQQFAGVLTWLIPLVVICALWDGVWKLIGMWRAGRNNDLAWFICIATLAPQGCRVITSGYFNLQILCCAA